MATTTLCTMFDKQYMAKGLALIESLVRHEPAFRLYILALDDETYDSLCTHPLTNVIPLSIDKIETPELVKVKSQRTWQEYVWTLGPFITTYCMEQFKLNSLAYLDADCFLFNSLAPLYAEVGNAPVAIIPHRWTPRHADRLRPNGIYNVSWVYFSYAGLNCLKHWRSQCLERCSLSVGCGDQCYLNDWPENWGAHVVEHLGANLAPWNQEQYHYSFKKDGQQLFISDGKRDDPLLFYHFHEFIAGKRRTNYPLHPMVANYVYQEYETQFETQKKVCTCESCTCH